MTLSSAADTHLIPQLRGKTAGRLISAKNTPWDHAIPPVLRPLVRAYLLGYASTVAPRVLTLVLQHLTRRRKGRPATTTANDATATATAKQPPQPPPPFFVSLTHILRSGLDWQRFPAFCAAIVGGSTLLEVCVCKQALHAYS